MASSRNGLGVSWRRVKLGALGLFDIFLTKTSFLNSLFIFLIWKLSQSSLKRSRYIKLSIPRLITFQKSKFLRHYSRWRVVLLARRAMNIAHSLWRVMLLAAASDECQHGQNAVFSPKIPFFSISIPKTLYRSVIRFCLQPECILTLLHYSLHHFHPKITLQNLTPKSPISTKTMLNPKSKLYNPLLLKDCLTLTLIWWTNSSEIRISPLGSSLGFSPKNCSVREKRFLTS